MSAIYGQGYGSNHDWIDNTPQDNSKRTFYSCKSCRARFTHMYDEIPDIFLAIELNGVPDQCPKSFEPVEEPHD